MEVIVAATNELDRADHASEAGASKRAADSDLRLKSRAGEWDDLCEGPAINNSTRNIFNHRGVPTLAERIR